MKQIYLILLGSLMVSFVFAQTHFGTTKINKETVTSIQYNVAHNKEATEQGLQDKMKKYGNPRNSKGYMVYSGVQIPEISSDRLNLYFDVEQKSKKSENSVITLLIANQQDHFYTLGEHHDLFNRAKRFLDEFNGPIAAASLGLAIGAQGEAVKEIEQKLKKLREEGADYEKQKSKLEDNISKNSKDAAEMEQELAKQKTELETLMKKKKD